MEKVAKNSLSWWHFSYSFLCLLSVSEPEQGAEPESHHVLAPAPSKKCRAFSPGSATLDKLALNN
jgi:hypothetical protein